MVLLISMIVGQGPLGRTHGAPYRGYGYVLLRFEGGRRKENGNTTTTRQGPIALAVGAGWECLDIFSLAYIFSFLSPLWETARYRLQYCLEGPLNPKQPTKSSFSSSKRVCLNLLEYVVYPFYGLSSYCLLLNQTSYIFQDARRFLKTASKERVESIF